MFKTDGRRALLDDEAGKMCTGLWQAEQFWKMRSAKCARDCSESSVSHKNRKKLRGSEHFWKMKLAQCLHSMIRWLQLSLIQWLVSLLVH
jgi:hypothetical protein